MSSISALLLDPATKHQEVLRRAERAWDLVQRGEYVLSLCMRRLFRDNVHRGGTAARFGDWAERELGMPSKLANLFSFLGKHLERLPLTREAFEAGRITYTKVREFAALATPEDEAFWVEFAATHTNRELERRVYRAREGTERDTREVVSRVSPIEFQAIRQVREDLMKKTKKAVPEEKLLPLLAETVLAGGLIGQEAGGKARAVEPFATIAHCAFCGHTWVPTPEGDFEVPLRDWIEALRDGAPVEEFVTKFLCDCEDVKHRRDLCPHHRPSEGPAPASRHVPAAVRRRIAARDGFRCRTPGCGNPGPMEIGHIRPHRDGAPMTEENLGHQCATCNEFIEKEKLVVVGEAPHERYYLDDGTFIGYGWDHRPFPRVGQDGKPFGKARGDPPGGDRRRA